jgi:hypothetical protein
VPSESIDAPEGRPRGGPPLVLGAGFGAATSFVNDVVSPFDQGDVATAVRALSLVIDSGWAWASLAFVAGWLAAEPRRGAIAGTFALAAATVAYFVVDSILRDEPLDWYLPELGRWLTATVVFGPALGYVGGRARKPDLIGLLARLTIPVGAATQLVVMPPGGDSPAITTPMSWARSAIAVVAILGAVAVITTFVLAERRRRRTQPSQ